MARNAWGTTVLTAFGTAAVIGTAQLGVAYGLTIMDWRTESAGLWSANIAWTTWLAAVSTVIGGLGAGGALTGREGRDGMAATIAMRLSAVLAAAVGAAVIAPLAALPAREVNDGALSTTPFLAVGIGIVAGMALALIAMVARPVAWGLYASTALVWVLALLSVTVPVGKADMPTAQLGVWGSWADLTSPLGQRGFAVAPPLIIGSALIGVLVAWFARNDGRGHRVVAASGIVGPLLITVAYLVAGPGTDSALDPVSAFLIGPYAAIAGLLGSFVVAAMRRDRNGVPAPTPVTAPAEDEPPYGGFGGDTSYERTSAAVPGEPDPYVDEYSRALEQVDSAFGGAAPQKARAGEDVPPPFPPPEVPEPRPAEEEKAPAKKTASKRRTKKAAATSPAAAEAPATNPDETEDWVTGLRGEETTETAEEPKKRPRRR